MGTGTFPTRQNEERVEGVIETSILISIQSHICLRMKGLINSKVSDLHPLTSFHSYGPSIGDTSRRLYAE